MDDSDASFRTCNLLCSDLSAKRLEMAKELGADFQLTVTRDEGAQLLAKKVEETLGAQPHVTIECTGVESCIQTAIYVRDSSKSLQGF